MKNYRISDEDLKALDSQIKEWKASHNNGIVMIELDEDPVDIIAKVPSAYHIKEANTLKDDFDKNKQLVLACVLHPSPERFSVILEEKDTIVNPIAMRLIKESGIAQETRVKKL